MAASLRTALEYELKTGTRFEILPLTTEPAGLLSERQTQLSIQLLHHWQQKKPSRIHLVGHSTGALDAELFIARTSLNGPWSQQQSDLRKLIRSVVAIAEPAAGSGIAASPLGRVIATDSRYPWYNPLHWVREAGEAEGLKELWRALAAVLKLGRTNNATGELIAGGADDLHPLKRFLVHLFWDRALLVDLQPPRTRQIRAAAGPVDTGAPAPKIARYLTVAVAQPGDKPTGALFKALYRSCAEGMGQEQVQNVVDELNARIENEKIPIFKNPLTKPPLPLTKESNDSIVNTCLQLPDASAGSFDEVVALLVGDHLDVVGGFPMSDADPGQEANGFLNSGSRFRGPQFTQLYRSVAETLARQMRA